MDSRAIRCVVAVGSAYLVQGLIAGVGAQLLGLLARQQIELEQQVGFLASGALPWLLKFGIALVVDLLPSAPLRARGLAIAGLQACVAAGLWALAASWEEQAIATLALIWVGINFAAALQDILVDNLALDTLSGRQSWTAMAMGSGHALGFAVLGPLVIGTIIAEHGTAAGLRTPVSWVVALAVVVLASLWLPGTPTRARTRTRNGGSLTRVQWLGLLGLLGVFAASTFAGNLTGALTGEFLFNHLGWDYLGYTHWLLPVGGIASVVGALACGPIVARFGPARASMLASIGLGLVWLSFAAAEPLWHTRATIIGLACCEGPLQYAMLVGLRALALVAAARSPLPTTTYTAAMVALNLSLVVAPMLAPKWLGALGYVGVFAACGLVQILTATGLWPLRDRATGQPASDVRPSP